MIASVRCLEASQKKLAMKWKIPRAGVALDESAMLLLNGQKMSGRADWSRAILLVCNDKIHHVSACNLTEFEWILLTLTDGRPGQ